MGGSRGPGAPRASCRWWWGPAAATAWPGSWPVPPRKPEPTPSSCSPLHTGTGFPDTTRAPFGTSPRWPIDRHRGGSGHGVGPQFSTGKEKYWPKVLRRLSELPNVLGFEDSSGDIAMGQELGTLVSDRLVWIARGEGHAVKALPAGARGNTSAVATFVPQACREFCRLGRLGEVDSMQEVLRTRIQPIARVRSLSPGYHVSGIKVALEALGRAGGPVRPPGRAVLPEDRPRIAAIAREHAED